MKTYTRDVVIDREEAAMIIAALKRYECDVEETDMTRLLVQRFRRVRSLIAGDAGIDTPDAHDKIYGAGLGE